LEQTSVRRHSSKDWLTINFRDQQPQAMPAIQTTGEYAVGWFTLSLINAGLAQSKNRSGLGWWFASLFLGPICTLLIVLLDPIPRSQTNSAVAAMNLFAETLLQQRPWQLPRIMDLTSVQTGWRTR
jgi:hypothetical protein